jgi:hypothetical protein
MIAYLFQKHSVLIPNAENKHYFTLFLNYTIITME